MILIYYRYRRLTRDFRNRRLTRDSRSGPGLLNKSVKRKIRYHVVAGRRRLGIPGIIVSLEIPVSRIFSRKKSGKIRKICFSDSRDQNKITKFLWFFYTTSISYINPFFRAPSPPGPLKSRPGGQNLPGDPLIAQSDHREPVSDQFYGLCSLFFTLSHLKWPYFKLNKWSSLILD